MAHYGALADGSIPTLRDIEFGWNPPSKVLGDLARTEDAWQARQNENTTRAYGEMILELEDGWSWWDLHKAGCSIEASNMGHCGNGIDRSDEDGETLLSLRREVGTDPATGDKLYMSYATFVLDTLSGSLGEMKGRFNQPPENHLHPYIVSLLEKHDPIVAIKGGGYLSENNFALSDLDGSDYEHLLNAKPSLFSLAALLERFEPGDKVGDIDISKKIREFLSAGLRPDYVYQEDGVSYYPAEDYTIRDSLRAKADDLQNFDDYAVFAESASTGGLTEPGDVNPSYYIGEYEDEIGEGIQAWLEANPDTASKLFSAFSNIKQDEITDAADEAYHLLFVAEALRVEDTLTGQSSNLDDLYSSVEGFATAPSGLPKLVDEPLSVDGLTKLTSTTLGRDVLVTLEEMALFENMAATETHPVVEVLRGIEHEESLAHTLAALAASMGSDADRLLDFEQTGAFGSNDRFESYRLVRDYFYAINKKTFGGQTQSVRQSTGSWRTINLSPGASSLLQQRTKDRYSDAIDRYKTSFFSHLSTDELVEFVEDSAFSLGDIVAEASKVAVHTYTCDVVKQALEDLKKDYFSVGEDRVRLLPSPDYEGEFYAAISEKGFLTLGENLGWRSYTDFIADEDYEDNLSSLFRALDEYGSLLRRVDIETPLEDVKGFCSSTFASLFDEKVSDKCSALFRSLAPSSVTMAASKHALEEIRKLERGELGCNTQDNSLSCG
jgi:hypothetical protein